MRVEEDVPGWLGVGERSLHVEVANKMLAEALAATAQRHGWSSAGQGGSLVLVTDRISARTSDTVAGGARVLVCDPTAFDARRALDAVAELLVTAVVLADEPADLAPALAAVVEDRVSVPGRVVRLAGEMPLLSERQSAVLAAMVSGATNTEISRDLFLSLATVKREAAVLYDALSASTRPSLIANARALGVGVTG